MSEDPVKYEPLEGADPFRGRTFTALESEAYNMGYLSGKAERSPLTPFGEQQIRIEALRLAEKVVSREPWWRTLTFRGERVTKAKGITLLAKQFAAYLEGEE